jgi:ATP-dependent protease ClpP protease subunit
MADILLFGAIGQYNAMFFFEQIKEALEVNPSDELIMRVNTVGGEPQYAMSIIEKVQETPDQFYFKGAGMMHSMGLFLAAYIPVERCECLDTTQAVLHRASYGEWIESQPWYKGSVYETINVDSNKKVEKAFRARIDVAALEALPAMKERNLTLKDIFSLESRHEVVLTGADLKKIGLVSKINKVTPSKVAELNAQFKAFEKCTSLSEFKLAAQAKPTTTKEDSNENFNTMTTLAELKAKHPELYAAARKEGIKKGVAMEKARVEEIMVYADYDLKAAKEAIESGVKLSGKQTAEFMLKAASKNTLTAIAEGGADAGAGTGGAALGKEGAAADPKKAEAARLKATQESINKLMGIKDPLIVVGE